MTHTEHPEYLLIRAKQAYDKVAADPERYRHESELLVAEARRARDPEALVLALRALAWAERARLKQTEAIRLLAEAARIARRRRYDEILAEVLITHAAVSQELGRISAAHRSLRTAATLVAPGRLPELDFNRAVLLQNTGHLDEAVAIYHRLLPGTGLSPRRQVQVPNNLALIEAEQGRYSAALRRLDQALPLAREVGPHLVAHVIHSRAWVAVQSGRFVEGLANFDSAVHEYQAAGLPLGEHYIDYADGLMELRLLPEAADAARRAVEELSAAGTAMMAADAQLKVAQLALLSGDTGEALAASAAAADAYRRQARATGRARSLLVTAEARLSAGGLTPEDLAAARGAARRLAAAGATAAAVHGYLVTGRLAAALGLRAGHYRADPGGDAGAGGVGAGAAARAAGLGAGRGAGPAAGGGAGQLPAGAGGSGPAPGEFAVGGAAGAGVGARGGAGADRAEHCDLGGFAGPGAALDGAQPGRGSAGGGAAEVRGHQCGSECAAGGCGGG